MKVDGLILLSSEDLRHTRTEFDMTVHHSQKNAQYITFNSIYKEDDGQVSLI